MEQTCLVATSKEEVPKLESLTQKKRKLPVIFKEQLDALYSKGDYQITRRIGDYLQKISIPQISDPADFSRLLFYIENFIMLKDAEEIFLQVAEGKFRGVGHQKMYSLNEAGLVVHSEGKWTLSRSMDRRLLIELLNEYGSMTNIPVEDLVKEVRGYRDPVKIEEEEREYRNFVRSQPRTYFNRTSEDVEDSGIAGI